MGGMKCAPVLRTKYLMEVAQIMSAFEKLLTKVVHVAVGFALTLRFSSIVSVISDGEVRA